MAIHDFAFDEKELEKLKLLSRIDCTPEEAADLFKKIQRTLTQIQQLDEVNTDGVEECCSVLEEVYNVMRSDEIGAVVERQTLLSNAPEQVGGMIRVPTVIKQ